jgi:hypothetical protein
MKVMVTSSEKRKLDHFYRMMNDESLSLSQRRVAKMRFDAIYNEAATRTFEDTTSKKRLMKVK